MSNQSLVHNDQAAYAADEIKQPKLEDAVYPSEFLNAIKDTAFQALEDYLKSVDAHGKAFELLEDILILTTWMDGVKDGSQVRPVTNSMLVDAVASTTRHIVEIGGVFYCPKDQFTIAREIVREER